MYLLQKEKGLLETSRAGWEAQERVLRVKIQHREELLEGGEVWINFFTFFEAIPSSSPGDGSWWRERGRIESSN